MAHPASELDALHTEDGHVLLQELTWPAVAALDRDLPVVIPVAALEQHGGHLPLFTDSMLLAEVLRRASGPLLDEALVAPLMWLGNSHHHLDFAGTLSAAPRTYLDLLRGLLDNFLTHGFRRLILVNGHGGNIVPCQQAVFEARQDTRSRDGLLLLATTYWTMGGQPYAVDPSIQQRRMGHACEWETSMLLRLAPHLVGAYQHLEEVPFEFAFEETRGWITRERSMPGHIGNPRLASPEKGEVLFRVFAEDLVNYVRQVAAWSPPAP
jgi:creatinine amidohydrolase